MCHYFKKNKSLLNKICRVQNYEAVLGPRQKYNFKKLCRTYDIASRMHDIVGPKSYVRHSKSCVRHSKSYVRHSKS